MASSKKQTRRYIDLSGGINTYVSDSLILDNQCIKMVNLVNMGNKIQVIPGFQEYINANKTIKGYKDGDEHEIQGMAFDGKYLVYIINRSLVIYNTINGRVFNIQNAVGFNSQNSDISFNETYHITIWNDYFIVTNSLMNENSLFYKVGEPPRVFGLKEVDEYEITQEQIDSGDVSFMLDDEGRKVDAYKAVIIEVKSTQKFTPRWSQVINNSIYFAGGPKGLSRFTLWKGPTFNRKSITDDAMILDMVDFTNPIGTYSLFVGNGAEINAIINNLGNIFIGKTDGFYIVEETLSGELITPKVRKVTQSGVLSNYSWVDVNNQVFYYDGVSVRILSQELQNSLTDQSISKNIQKDLDCMPREQKWASMTFEYPFVKLFLSNNNEYNDTAFVFNVETHSWSKQTGLMVRYTRSGYVFENQKMNSFLSGINGIIYQDNDGTSFADEPIEFEWITKGFIFNEDPFQSYKLHTPKIYGENNGDVELALSVISENVINNNIILEKSKERNVALKQNKENKVISSCDNSGKYLLQVCEEDSTGYKQYIHLKGKTISLFTIEQLTFDIEQESRNKNVLQESVSWADKI